MKILALTVLRALPHEAEATTLAAAYHLNDFNYFQRGRYVFSGSVAAACMVWGGCGIMGLSAFGQVGVGGGAIGWFGGWGLGRPPVNGRPLVLQSALGIYGTKFVQVVGSPPNPVESTWCALSVWSTGGRFVPPACCCVGGMRSISPRGLPAVAGAQ